MNYFLEFVCLTREEQTSGMRISRFFLVQVVRLRTLRVERESRGKSPYGIKVTYSSSVVWYGR
jgi:hypothetical protein